MGSHPLEASRFSNEAASFDHRLHCNTHEYTYKMSEQNKQGPSQISGQLKVGSVTDCALLTLQNLQGMAEQAIGSVLPGATGDAWIESGQKLQKEGQVEVEGAKIEAKKDATVDSAKGKAKS